MDPEFGNSSKFSDEQEVFEIRDYTTASEWETFIAHFEEVLNEWKLTGDEPNIIKIHLNTKDLENAEWHEQSSTINFADYSFYVTHHYVSLEGRDESNEVAETETEDKEEMPQFILQTINKEVDFATKSHCINRWFGLHQFVILSPAPTMEPLTSHTRTKLLLSSLAIAANNTNCQIPLFVQTRKPENKVFTGIAISNGLRTDFDMSYIRKLSLAHANLDGIADILRQKINLDVGNRGSVAVRFTYKLPSWIGTPYTLLMPDYDPLSLSFDFSNFTKLPFGAILDPVGDLFLSTYKPSFTCEFDDYVEDKCNSIFNPNIMLYWNVRLTAPNYLGKTLLSDIMRAFVATSQNQMTIRQILGAEFDPLLAENANIGSAFNKLTEGPVPSLSDVLSRGTNPQARKPAAGPISEDVLTQVLWFLFPDSNPYSPHKYPSEVSQVPAWEREFEQMPEEPPLKTVFSNIKSCAIDSFVWRLMIVSSYLVMSIGKAALAQLLYEIYMELRFRWDNSIPLPGVQTSFPDLATCLFNQKMQMLNYCIAKRQSKEGKTSEPEPSQMDVESEDDYYECNSSAESDCTDESRLPEWDKPEGRLRRLEGNHPRLQQSRSFLYVPVTQETPPATEDRLDQQNEELMRLGSDATASHNRARLMSVSLLSDMESFKAANPRCVLEDFVRWYSPRDWIPDGKGESGHLSVRMLVPGNLWQETWQQAVPVPARRQKRLFDETRESETVLQWLAHLRPADLCTELLPVLSHACLARMTEQPILFTLPASVSSLPMPLHCRTLFAQLELTAQRALRISRSTPAEAAAYEGLLEQFRAIEIDITRANSLRFKILGHSRLSSAAFKYSASPSVATALQTDHSAAKQIGVDESKMEVNPTKLTKQEEEEEMMEKLIYNLLTNQEISVDDAPAGPQATAIVKLFDKSIIIKEREVFAQNATPEERICQQQYNDVSDFYLGFPFAREYMIRARSKFPASFSRLLPQRIFVVFMPSEFRMAGAITQDTLFC